MGNIRRHARNLAANWVGQAAGLVVVFFMSPFVVHTLGKTEYGLWSLLNVFTGYLGVFDLGMRASTGRFVIFYVGRKDDLRVNETIRTGLSAFSVLSLLILLAAIGLSWAFPVFFPSVPASYHATLRMLLPLLALNIWLSAMSGAFTSVMAAHDRFDLTNTVDISVLLLRTAALVAVLKFGMGIVGMTVVTVAASALALAGNSLLARRVYPALRVWPPKISRERLRELFGFGAATFVGSIAGMLIGQTDLVVVGILFGVSAVTMYSVGAMLVMYTTPFIGQISGTIFPSLQRSVGSDDHDGVRWTYVRMMKLAFIVGLPMYIGFLFFGSRFIHLWMGESFVDAFPVMAILSISRLVNLAPGSAGTVLYAKGRVWWLTTAALVFALTNVGASLVFALGLGWALPGVAAGNLAAVCLLAPFFLRQASRQAVLSIAAITIKVLLPAVCAAGAFAGWCFLVRTVIISQSWAWFAVQVVLALLGYAVVAGVLLVPRSDRARLWKLLGVGRAASGPHA